MTRVIAITSGKGGVGKTSLTTNLGVALGKLGKRVVMIDLDIQMANLGMMVGMKERPISVQDVLNEEANSIDAMYDLRENVKIMPARLAAGRPDKIPAKRLAKIVQEIKETLGPDIVLLDTAPGMGDDVKATIEAATEAIVVTMPEPVSVADSMKMVMFIEKHENLRVIGTVVNMVKGIKGEMKNQEIEQMVSTEITGIIPEDPDLRLSSLNEIPVMDNVPDAPAAIAIMSIAARLVGVAPPVPQKKKTKSFIEKIRELFQNILKR
ncbi:cell division ATPase MinD [archaeon]|nr:cell division ATPase MinD [archaeon]